MKTKYNVGDVVYWVSDYKVVKSTVKEVVIKKTCYGVKITYMIVSYKVPNDVRKQQQCVEAQLVTTIVEAKESALLNWTRITKQVEESLINLTDKSFEPIPVKG